MPSHPSPTYESARLERRHHARQTRVLNLKVLKPLVESEQRAKVSGQRPRTRGECFRVPRPCPWISCRHNLYCDALPTGSLLLNWPNKEPHELAESCALDVADQGEHTLEEVGAAMNLTRERVRQLEDKILTKLYRYATELKEHLGDGLEVWRGIEDEDKED